MTNITVTCRCGRAMRQEPGRVAGHLMCSCGTKVRIIDHHHDLCHGRDEDGEPCRQKLVITHPLALCKRHVSHLAKSEAFMKESIADSQYQAWKRRLTQEGRETDRQRTMRERRRDHENQLYQEWLAAQSVVYYIVDRSGYVKIGTTNNMQARMSSLLPDAILATEPGGRHLEKQRHRQFKNLRADLGREYFQRHPDLMQHIDRIRAEHGEPAMTGYPANHEWHPGGNVLTGVSQAAKLAGISASVLYRWITEERLTVTKQGGKMMVNPREVLELVGLQRAGKLPRFDTTAAGGISSVT